MANPKIHNRPSFESVPLNDLLMGIENRLGKYDDGIGPDPLNVLLVMDEIQARLARSSGASRKANAGHFEYIQMEIKKRSKELSKALGGKPGLDQARKEFSPPSKNWWWFVDQEVNAQNKAQMQRSFLTVFVVIFLGGLAILIYNQFIAPDPQFIQRLRLQEGAEESIIDGEYETALKAINQALDIEPRNVELTILKGITLRKMGLSLEAKEITRQSQEIAGTREDYLAVYAMMLLRVGSVEEAKDAAWELIQIAPDSLQGHYYYGAALEELGQYNEALLEMEKAAGLAAEQGSRDMEATIRVNIGLLKQRVPLLEPIE